MSYQIFTQPSQQALDTAANVLSGATLTFSLTGTSTPTDAFSDPTLATPVANPLSADAGGVFIPVFLDPAVVYRVVLKTQAGAVMKTWDPANEDLLAYFLATLTQAFIGGILFPRTAAEIAAGVTPANYAYESLLPSRYSTWANWRSVIAQSSTAASQWNFWSREDDASLGLGFNALKAEVASSGGTQNTAIGHGVMAISNGSIRNTVVGADSLIAVTTGYENTVMGAEAATSLTIGTRNTAIGNRSMVSMTNENENTAIGSSALHETNAAKNTAVGREAGYNITTGEGNVALGYDALFGDATAKATGFFNVAVGYQSLLSATTAARNVAVGFQSLAIATTAYTNTCIGYGAGSAITTGQYNVVIGGASGSGIATLSNRVIISDGVGTSRLEFDANGKATFLAPITIPSTSYFIGNATNGYRFNNGADTQTRATLSDAGAWRWHIYGAGTITSDASGNLTSVSDERLKRNIRPFNRGLAEILSLVPILHGYTEESGLDQSRDNYAGFSAQNVMGNIPEAIGKDAAGFLSFSERPVLAALVNAVKELDSRTRHL